MDNVITLYFSNCQTIPCVSSVFIVVRNLGMYFQNIQLAVYYICDKASYWNLIFELQVMATLTSGSERVQVYL
jgi:hypothetical protein